MAVEDGAALAEALGDVTIIEDLKSALKNSKPSGYSEQVRCSKLASSTVCFGTSQTAQFRKLVMQLCGQKWKAANLIRARTNGVIRRLRSGLTGIMLRMR